MGEMAEWVNDDTPWDGLGPDPEERASLERAEAAKAEVDRLRKLCLKAARAIGERKWIDETFLDELYAAGREEG